MLVLEKIRESIESIPLELSRYMGKSEEDIFLSPKASPSQNLHINILTPDKIPEFCLPPRLCKRSQPMEAKKTAPFPFYQDHTLKSSTLSHSSYVKTENLKKKNINASMTLKTIKKPLPFSAEGYGLTGIYESPNTRRKESLFHSKRPVYLFDRSRPNAAPRLAKETNLPKKTLLGFLPLCSTKSLSETGSTGSKTPSSSDSSPLSLSYSAKSSLHLPPGSGHLKGAKSCPSLINSRENRVRLKRGGLSLTTSSSSPPSLEGSSLTLAPPALFPPDVLQCQERPQHEHFLTLQGRGRVHLYAEATTFSTNKFSSLSTIRVYVESVEGLWDDSDRRTLNCAVNLCLIPGKLQQQEGATIRNCCSPVFKEDFFFTELRREELQELQLRLKVVGKPAAGTMRRETVIGTVTKPLSELLHLKK
ncbi:LOW QUALITY PROTEIN: C2 calcium-dependent domain-containing protein 4C [Eleginops maclovinus]|uniref:LOW QUALITY PROTEIN: C2 calcium-dependent domain-containing protein 4C n=1 Tax=Eleginops maclovinus TaxID=56733 RepID=UPI00308009B3